MRKYSIMTLGRFAVLVASLVGCASFEASNMGRIDAAGLERHGHVISLRVESDVEGQMIEGSNLFPTEAPGASDVESAFSSAVTNSQFFAGVEPDAPYELRAVIRQVAMADGTEEGVTRSVRAVINWSFRDSSAGEALWEKRIVTTCTHTASDHLEGGARLYSALEGAFRMNIESALADLQASGSLGKADG